MTWIATDYTSYETAVGSTPQEALASLLESDPTLLPSDYIDDCEDWEPVISEWLSTDSVTEASGGLYGLYGLHGQQGIDRR